MANTKFSFSQITADSLTIENQECYQSKENRFLSVVDFLKEKIVRGPLKFSERHERTFLDASEPSELCARQNQWVKK